MKRVIGLAANGEVREHTQAKAPTLDELQKLVGGYIQQVPHWVKHDGLKADVWCDEDGKVNDKPFNRRATTMWYAALGVGSLADFLVGDVVIVTSAPKEPADG